MKILMINGSPHPCGCTYTALHEMEQVLQAAGVETQILTVGAEQAGGCTACGGCNATGHCVRGGLVNDAIDAMETADALVLASPVHYAGISGAMSAFCDRLFYAGDGWANKPCACVVSARRAGTTAALDQLVKYPMISNMPVVSSQYWASAGLACGGPLAIRRRYAQPCFFARRLPVMCSTVRHRTVVAGMTAFEYGKSGARYCAMSTCSARSLSASGTSAMRP